MYVSLNSPALAQQAAQSANPAGRLADMMNEKAGEQSPLEAAKQALLNVAERKGKAGRAAGRTH